MDSRLNSAVLGLAAALWVAAVALVFTPQGSLNELWAAPSRPSARTAVPVAPQVSRINAVGPLNANLKGTFPEQAGAALAMTGTVATASTVASQGHVPVPVAAAGASVALLAILLAFFKPPTSPRAVLATSGPASSEAGAEELELGKLLAQPMAMAGKSGLSPAQKKLATHICADCGYIYTLPKAFADQPASYTCPQCGAGKDRFATYDPETGKMGGVGVPSYLIWTVVGSAAFIGAILLAASGR